MADIENTNSQATSPTGDIKIFIDTFNSELDKEIKLIQDAKSNYKNIYESAIQISTPLKEGDWPNDPKVLTIGDLFKYTFPDIEGYTYINDARNPLKSLKDDVQKEMYPKILEGINSNKNLNTYLSIKKPGVTNPDLYSAGQYWFDVFMKKVLSSDGPIFRKGSVINTYSNSYGSTASISLFTPTGNKEDKKFDYVDFEEHVLSDIEGYVNSITNIDINLLDNNGSFSGLKTQYKSGILTNISNDPNFNIQRGEVNETTGEFIGNYEQILLYKAFVQAGDNYKPVVLSYNKPVDPTPPPVSQNTTSNVEQPTDVFKFNVEKQDTFVVVGGTSSTVMEFIIVPNDGTEYIFDNTQYDYGPLDDEYTEDFFQGTEEELIKFESVEIESLNDIKGFDPNNPDDELSTDSNGKYPISKDKDANIKSIINAAKSLGVTNKFAIAAILAIVSKESGFVPRSEASYAKTSGARIIKIFGSKGYSAAEWDVIKKDPVKFFNLIYGGKYGNASNEGYKYRGRGFNQITFKGNYQQYAKETGIDIVSDPDLLNTVDAAAKCLIAYFKRNIKNANSSIRSLYNFSDINSFANLNDATGAIYHANAGWGKSYKEIVADSTGGRKKAFANAGPLYNTYQSQIS